MSRIYQSTGGQPGGPGGAYPGANASGPSGGNAGPTVDEVDWSQ